VVERLLQVEGVDAAAAKQNYAIRWAAKNGHVAVVELLCETLRLQILADYYHSFNFKGNFDINIDPDVFMQGFKAVVKKRLDYLDDTKTIVEEKIIKRTADSLELIKQVVNSDAGELPNDLLPEFALSFTH